MHEAAAFCRDHGLWLNKDLGQHFLIDDFILMDILDAGDVSSTDHVVEIGPGIGVLTKELVAKAKHVTAIELDLRFVALLKKYAGFPENLTVLNTNALEAEYPSEPYKIIANIPYHITSPLLRKVFLESKQIPTSMTLLIQKEVAQKICDTKSAGILTILVGLFGKPTLITKVPPSAFLPPPKVDSAVLHIDCFEQPLADVKTIDTIFSLTKSGFSQKRKMLRNTLGQLPDAESIFQKLDIDLERRPQTLTIEEWIALAREFSQK